MPITNRNPVGPVAGTVAHFAASTAPAGWLKANGALVSRAAYAALFAAINTTFGAGDGVATFAIPDLRGEFLRGLDDGRGVDSARAIGSAQSHQYAAHTHSLPKGDQPGTGAGAYYAQYPTSGGAAASGSSGGTSNSSETRPRNVALLACIKF